MLDIYGTHQYEYKYTVLQHSQLTYVKNSEQLIRTFISFTSTSNVIIRFFGQASTIWTVYLLCH